MLKMSSVAPTNAGSHVTLKEAFARSQRYTKYLVFWLALCFFSDQTSFQMVWQTGCWYINSGRTTKISYHYKHNVSNKLPPTLLGLYRFDSARSTLVRTKMVLLPLGSIWLTTSVTLLRSASSDPSDNVTLVLNSDKHQTFIYHNTNIKIVAPMIWR